MTVFQGPNKDFALHTIGWQAFQDLAVSIAETEYARTVSRVAKSSDEGRDGSFYGVPDEPLAKGDKRETTIQSKHFSSPKQKLTVAGLKEEFASVRRLVESGRADGYVLMTNATVSEADRKKIVKALRDCGVDHPYVHGRDWVVAKVLEHPRVRALVPRVYGLGDLSWITDKRALDQAEAILDQMGDDLACYVPTKAHNAAVRALEQHRVLLLLGDPAVGKSSIAAALSVAATDEDKCEVIYVRNPEEFVSNWNPEIEGRLFWIDDAFGSIQYAPELADRWNKVFQSLKAATKRGNRFILTSRTYIWRQARFDLKVSAFPPLSEGKVVVDVEKLTPAEKERILYNHLKFGKQSSHFLTQIFPFLDDLVTSPHFRPELARRLGDPAFTGGLALTAIGLQAFFRNPERFLRDTISNLERPFQAAIGLIFVKAGRLLSPIVEDEATQLISAAFGATVAQMRFALESMKGSFVSFVTDEDDTYWTYKHPTIADAFASMVGGSQELVSVYVRGTKLPQILREARCGGDSKPGTSVAIPASHYDLLLDRFAHADKPLPESDLRRFLVERCGPRFFKLYLERFESTFPWGNSLARPIDRNDRTRLTLKAAHLGVLPPERRTAFLNAVEAVVVDQADVEFLLDNAAFDTFLTDEDRDELLAAAKGDLIRNLGLVIETEADAYESGWDPYDWFGELRSAVTTLERLFPDDEEVLAATENARQAIDDQVRSIRTRIEEDEEEPDGEHASEALTAVSSKRRSIFDDLIA